MDDWEPPPEETDASYESRISLRIRDTDIAPDELTVTLGMVPDGAYAQGDHHKLPNGRLNNGIYAATFWHKQLIHSACEPLFLGDELLALLIELEQHAALFARIKASGGRSELFIGWFLAQNSGLHLNAEVMVRFGSLGIDLDFDVYIRDHQ